MLGETLVELAPQLSSMTRTDCGRIAVPEKSPRLALGFTVLTDPEPSYEWSLGHSAASRPSYRCPYQVRRRASLPPRLLRPVSSSHANPRSGSVERRRTVCPFPSNAILQLAGQGSGARGVDGEMGPLIVSASLGSSTNERTRGPGKLGAPQELGMRGPFGTRLAGEAVCCLLAGQRIDRPEHSL